MSLTKQRTTITSKAALAAVIAALAHGETLGKAVAAAVADASGQLLALQRADGAYLASIGIAQDKAYTAAIFGAPTDAFGKAVSASDAAREGLGLRPNVVLFGGGLPVIVDGVVVGGIGVSGGSEDDDKACAQAGLTALGLE